MFGIKNELVNGLVKGIIVAVVGTMAQFILSSPWSGLTVGAITTTIIHWVESAS